MPRALLFLVIIYAALLAAGAQTPPPVSSPSPPAPDRSHCRQKCGDIDIPYPFGVGDSCSMRNFHVTCNETTSTPFLQMGNVRIASINMEAAQIIVYNFLTFTCTIQKNDWAQDMVFNVTDTPYLISPASNMFVSVGCGSVAKIQGVGDAAYLTGCITTCATVNDTGDDGSPCSGQGCCEASLTPGLSQVKVTWSLGGANLVKDNPCQYAFVAKKGCCC